MHVWMAAGYVSTGSSLEAELPQPADGCAPLFDDNIFMGRMLLAASSCSTVAADRPLAIAHVAHVRLLCSLDLTW